MKDKLMLLELTQSEASELLRLILAITEDLGIIDSDSKEDLTSLILLNSIAAKLSQ